MPKNPQNFVGRFDLYFSEKNNFLCGKINGKIKKR